MNKSKIIILLVAALVAGATTAPAEAGKTKPKRFRRVIEIAYSHPGLGAAPGGGYPIGFPDDAVSIPLTQQDLFITLEVEDASGENVWGFISQGDINGDGLTNDGYAVFCGASEDPVPIAAIGKPIIGVYAFSGTCNSGSPSVMTTGTIRVTLSNRP